MKRFLLVGIAVLVLGGWSLSAHASSWPYASACNSANCWIQIDEANDPAYQAAIHRSYPYRSPYYYPDYRPYSYYPYSSMYMYPYDHGYQYQNSYYYRQNTNTTVNSYRQNNCLYVIKIENGIMQTTRTCVN